MWLEGSEQEGVGTNKVREAWGRSQSTLQAVIRTLDFLLKPLEGVEQSRERI